MFKRPILTDDRVSGQALSGADALVVRQRPVAILAQIGNYGQTPVQLLKRPHPRRNVELMASHRPLGPPTPPSVPDDVFGMVLPPPSDGADPPPATPCPPFPLPHNMFLFPEPDLHGSFIGGVGYQNGAPNSNPVEGWAGMYNKGCMAGTAMPKTPKAWKNRTESSAIDNRNFSQFSAISSNFHIIFVTFLQFFRVFFPFSANFLHGPEMEGKMKSSHLSNVSRGHSGPFFCHFVASLPKFTKLWQFLVNFWPPANFPWK